MTEYAAIFNFIAVIALYSILSFAGFVEMDYIRIGKCITTLGLGYGQESCFSSDSEGGENSGSGSSLTAGGEAGDPEPDPACSETNPFRCAEDSHFNLPERGSGMSNGIP